ncbi:MAG: S9 family peptidase [Nocardioidaceae bacterium]|nr:S9 family peptidase [Nocardioidaceae bacterium]
MTDQTSAWFPPGMLLTARPAGGPGGRVLLVEDGKEHAEGRVWDPAAGTVGPVLPFPVGFGSLLTPDGQWVVALDDDGGSEVGTLVATRVDGGERRALTPGWSPYVLRGLEISPDGRTVVGTLVDDEAHHVVLVPLDGEGEPTEVFSSPEEAWFAHVSADGTLVSVDTIEHNPGVRRAAVTVVDVATRAVVAVANDLPDGPVRAVRFSTEPGDDRLLLATERTGFARPAIWDPRTGERVDFDLPELDGETLVLDWHPASGRILLVHVDHGKHRLLVLDESTRELEVVRDRPGAYAEPDVAAEFPYYWKSFFAADGAVVVLASGWTTPLHVLRVDAAGEHVVVPPVPVPAGRRLESATVTSADGTGVQLWWAAPAGEARGTVLDIHGGPNLVTVDQYRPELQAWLERGFAVASLNYRGSVSFGRAIREGFWGGAGDREIEDVAAAVGWLRGRGLADPASTFITGPSYGGHLSLLSVGRLPDLFAGAFAVVAMADWAAAWPEMNAAIRKSWSSFLSMDPSGAFDPARVEPALVRFSAINYVDDVRASVWLFQGARDTRTPPEQARRYAEALRQAGGDVVIEWFDAGHEPTGIAGAEAEFRRQLELAELTLAGGRWS